MFDKKPEEKKNETEKPKEKKGLWKRIFNKNKLVKPQMVAVVYCRKNNVAELLDIESKNGFFEVDKKVYHVERDCLYHIGKERIPLAVIREEGLIPMGNADFYKKIVEMEDLEEKVAAYQNLALKAIRHAEMVKMAGEENQSKINPKVVIGLLIAAVIGFAIFKAYSGGG